MADFLKLDSINSATLGLEPAGDGLLLGVLVEMTQLANVSISAKVEATLQNLLDGDTITASASQGFDARAGAAAVVSGTAEGQADWIWSDTARAISSGANESIDLYDLGTIDIGAGAGKDALGQSVTLAEVVAILIHVDSDSVGELVVGGEGSAAAFSSPFNADDDAEVGPFGAGGCCLLFNPVDPAWTVTDSSNHLLKLAATGGDLTYSITVIGRSA